MQPGENGFVLSLARPDEVGHGPKSQRPRGGLQLGDHGLVERLLAGNLEALFEVFGGNQREAEASQLGDRAEDAGEVEVPRGGEGGRGRERERERKRLQVEGSAEAEVEGEALAETESEGEGLEVVVSVENREEREN